MSKPTNTQLRRYADHLRCHLDNFIADVTTKRHDIAVVTNADGVEVRVALRAQTGSRDLVSVCRDGIMEGSPPLATSVCFGGQYTYLFVPSGRVRWGRSQAFEDAGIILNESVVTQSKPKRIQRKRTKGWRMPPGAIYVGRGSRWGNPFKIGEVGDLWFVAGKAQYLSYETRGWRGSFLTRWRAEAVAVEMYAEALDAGQLCFTVDDVRCELRGHDLCCWCGDGPCHADVLLEIVNEDKTDV